MDDQYGTNGSICKEAGSATSNCLNIHQESDVPKEPFRDTEVNRSFLAVAASASPPHQLFRRHPKDRTVSTWPGNVIWNALVGNSLTPSHLFCRRNKIMFYLMRRSTQKKE